MAMVEAVRYGVPPDIANQPTMISRLHEAEFKIYPNSGLEIPPLDEGYLGHIVGGERLNRSLGDINAMQGYLRMRPIGDKFGTNYRQRREWRESMFGDFGDVFNRIYKDDNQFTINNMAIGMNGIDDLSRCMKNIDLKAKLSDIWNESFKKIRGRYPNTEEQTGKPYEIMESDGERLGVVRFCELQFQSVLKMFSFSRVVDAS